ncbi:hypothetical protein EUTSA_v10002780mg [Eutrema salsugineum]|uniref:Protein EARLY FLOWERING 4 domain-containing protein n=1 Tax=Eutrema salsugineum TaxID=72664 RepID=V4KZT7_EUTSA|nr:hypothetical protein EUTSA_v10002780mg [Eutrema salsugineum]
MDGNTVSRLMGNGAHQINRKILQTFQNSFVQMQNILDQNRLLINEINQNHESRIPDNLERNVGLIRELNNNMRRVVYILISLTTSPNPWKLRQRQTQPNEEEARRESGLL